MTLNLLKPIISTTVTIAILSWLLPTIDYANWTALVLAGLVLTVLQKFVKPILSLLFLPINIITLGFFSLVLNVLILWLAMYLVPGFRITEMTVGGVQLNQFFSLLFASFLISFLQSIVGFIL